MGSTLQLGCERRSIDGRSNRFTARLWGCFVVSWFVATAFGQTFTKTTDTGLGVSASDAQGASWGDANGDGWLDLFVAANGQDELYLNNGNGTFTRSGQAEIDRDAETSISALWVDFDGDGDLDVYVSRWREANPNPNVPGQGPPMPNLLYVNDGHGHFSQAENHPTLAAVNATWTTAWADVDKDGDLDVFIPSTAGAASFFMLNDAGTYGSTPSFPFVWGAFNARTTNWIDYDMDGDQDLFILNRPQGPGGAFLQTYQNLLLETGTLAFRENRTTAMALFLTPIPLPYVAGGWLDYDSDGDLDLYVINDSANGGFENTLFENFFGEFVLEDRHPLAAYTASNSGMCWGDFDNDGDEDLYLTVNRASPAGPNPRPNRFYRSDGHGPLESVNAPPYTTDIGHYAGCAVADYDNDGDLDLYVTTASGGPGDVPPDVLYRNDDGNAKAWINLTLRSSTANTFALGARVEVEAMLSGERRVQTRYLHGNTTGHRDQSSQRLHFGLADATQIESITVYWSTGEPETYEQVAVNQFLHIMQGQGIRSVARETTEQLTASVVLHAAYPNPASTQTRLSYTLAEPSAVRLEVYDSLGRLVKALVDTYHSAGTAQVVVETANWAPGVYHYRLHTVPQVQSGFFTVVP